MSASNLVWLAASSSIPSNLNFSSTWIRSKSRLWPFPPKDPKCCFKTKMLPGIRTSRHLFSFYRSPCCCSFESWLPHRFCLVCSVWRLGLISFLVVCRFLLSISWRFVCFLHLSTWPPSPLFFVATSVNKDDGLWLEEAHKTSDWPPSSAELIPSDDCCNSNL